MKQFFGVELEFTGMTRNAAAGIVAAHFGVCARHTGGGYDSWEIVDLQGRTWKVMSDASVRDVHGNTRTIQSCELVTPKLLYEDVPDFQQIVRDLRTGGGVTNDSCGIHIHVDASNHTPTSLRNLAFIVNAKEDMIARALGVRDARLRRWCKPIEQKFIDRLKQNKNPTVEQMADMWYADYYGNRNQHYHDSRYHLLNYHSVFYRGTVEFRAFNATMHAGKIRAYINFCLLMSQQAIEQKRANPDKTVSENEKYTFRCWLLNLGMIGEEYESVRKHLLNNLTGNAAWLRDKNSYASYQRKTTVTQNNTEEVA